MPRYPSLLFALVAIPALALAPDDTTSHTKAKRTIHLISVDVQTPNQPLSFPLSVKAGDLIQVVITGFNPYVHSVKVQGESISYPNDVPKIFSVEALTPESSAPETQHTDSFVQTGIKSGSQTSAPVTKPDPNSPLRQQLQALNQLADLGQDVERRMKNAALDVKGLKAAFVQLISERVKTAVEPLVPKLTLSGDSTHPDFEAIQALLVDSETKSFLPESATYTAETKDLAKKLGKAVKAQRKQLDALKAAWENLEAQDPTRVHFLEAKDDELKVTVEVENTVTKAKVISSDPFHVEVRQCGRWLFSGGVAFTSIRDKQYRLDADNKIQSAEDKGDLRPLLSGFATCAIPVGKIAMGPTVGLGLGSEQRMSAFVGISVVLPVKGQFLALTVAYGGSYRKELDPSLQVGDTLPDDQKTIPLQDCFRKGLFFAISYHF